mgnify:CR=1 FL=1
MYFSRITRIVLTFILATQLFGQASDISVFPSSLTSNLPIDGIETQLLTISNTGDAYLNWNIGSPPEVGALTGNWNVSYDWGCDGEDGVAPMEFYADGTGMADGEAILWAEEDGTVALIDGTCLATTFTYNTWFMFPDYGTVYYVMIDGDVGNGPSDDMGDGTSDGQSTITRVMPASSLSPLASGVNAGQLSTVYSRNSDESSRRVNVTSTSSPHTLTESYYGTFGSSRTGEQVLVVRDILPWGGDVVPYWLELETVVTVIPSVDLATTNLSDYDVLYWGGDISFGDEFYLNIAANMDAISTFMTDGGVVFSATGSQGGTFTLPGGVLASNSGGWVQYPEAGHCETNELPVEVHGSDSYHDIYQSFEGVPGGVEEFSFGELGEAIGISYDFGMGRAIFIGNPSECYLVGGGCGTEDYPEQLDMWMTAAACALDNTNNTADWLSTDMSSGAIAPGSTQDVMVTFDATGMSAGTYTSNIEIFSNDPDESQVDVPATLIVAEECDPDIAVTPASLESYLLRGEMETQIVTISNDSECDLEYSVDIQESMPARAIDAPTDHPSHYFLEVDKGASDPRIGPDVIRDAGGPDFYGYSWIDSDEAGGPAFNWEDISATGMNITGDMWDDNVSGPYPLGFEFDYYGNTYTEFYVSSNGFIRFEFNDNSGCCSGQPLPMDDGINNVIAWAWRDGYPFGNTYYENFEDKTIIQFDGYGVCCTQEYASATVEIILYRNGEIKINYLELTGFYTDGYQSVGIENADGTDGLQVAFNTEYLHDELALLFTSGPQWLSVGQADGVLPPGSTQDVEVTFDATGMMGGDYYADIIITSNDPDENPVLVPTFLNVEVCDPAIAVAPEALDSELYMDEMETHVLTISNTGDCDLNWSFDSPPDGGPLTGVWNLTYDWNCDGEDGSGIVEFYPDGTGTADGEPLVWASEDGTVELVDGYCVATSFTFNTWFMSPDYGTVYYLNLDGDMGTGVQDDMGDGTSDGQCYLEPVELRSNLSHRTVDNSAGEQSRVFSSLGLDGQQAYVNSDLYNQSLRPNPVQGSIEITSGLNNRLNLADIQHLVASGQTSQLSGNAVSTFDQNQTRNGSSLNRTGAMIAILCEYGASGTAELETNLTDLGYNFVHVTSVAEAASTEADAIIAGYNGGCTGTEEISDWINSGKGYIQNGDHFNWFPNDFMGYEIGTPLTIELLDMGHPLAFNLPTSWSAQGFWLYDAGSYLGWVTGEEFSNIGRGDGIDRVITADQIGDGHAVYLGFSVFGSMAGAESNQLFANALEYVTGFHQEDEPWFTTDIDFGTVAPGSSQDVMVTFDANGLAAGMYSANLAITSDDPFQGMVNVPLSLNVLEGSGCMLGDIDRNDAVQAYDASIALMYSVGLDPIPEIDPIPWEDNRFCSADVDCDMSVLAYDASLILQYVVGTLEEWPCDMAPRLITEELVIDAELQNGSIVFYATGELASMNLSIPNVAGLTWGTPELSLPESQYAINQDEEQYRFGMMCSPQILDSEMFLSIPLVMNDDFEANQISVDMFMNATELQFELDMTTLALTDPAHLLADNALVGNYPNPFNPTTQLLYSVSEQNLNVEISIFDIRGRKVRTLYSGTNSMGNHSVMWNGKDQKGIILGAGTYIARAEIGQNVSITRLLLLK